MSVLDKMKSDYYSDAAEMWREYAQNYGLIPARILCHHYLNQNAQDPEEGEQIFCDQLRKNMAMGLNTLHTPVYLFNSRVAELSGKTELYNASMEAFEKCAEHIDQAIHTAVYGNRDADCHYNLALAALLDHHGLERVKIVLQCAVLHDLPFGRHTADVYDWAKDFKKPDHIGNFGVRTRPAVLAGLVAELRNKEAEISMIHFPPKEVVERLREQYPVGTRIELTSINDPFNDTLKPGDKGTVDHIDDTGTIFAAWDNGSGLGLVYGVDSCKKLEPELSHEAVDIGQNEPMSTPPEIPEIKQLIRFIDSDYREQFKIPDGDSIRITYPPGDGREPVERACKFRGEMHVDVGSSTYHICEFASAMERIGATFEPVNQLHNVELAPFTAGTGEDKFFTHNREESNTCAGSLHGDFGNNGDGDRFHASWKERDNGLYNSEIQSELQSVVYALRQDLLKDRASMLAYCESHPDAKISSYKSFSGEDYAIYGFKLETESRQYFVNCFTQGKDSRFSLFAYADKPAPVLEQGQQQQSQANGRTVPDTPKDKPSVLDEIRESRSAPKTPAKPKTVRDKGKKKNQPEH